MKKLLTALSMRASRNRKPKRKPNRRTYRCLEQRQLLAADFSPVLATVCDVSQPFESRSLENTINVTGITVGDGTDSRSMVDRVTLEFDGIVNPKPGAFEFVQRESSAAVELEWVVDNSSGISEVTLTFSGKLVEEGGSLIDGNYQLNVDGELLGGSDPGSDFVFGDTEEDNLFRYFGDTGGDREVRALELLEFRNTWLRAEGDADFDSRFDGNADEEVNIRDLLKFRVNFGTPLEWV